MEGEGMDRWTDRWMSGLKDSWPDGWKDGWAGCCGRRETDRQTDRQSLKYKVLELPLSLLCWEMNMAKSKHLHLTVSSVSLTLDDFTDEWLRTPHFCDTTTRHRVITSRRFGRAWCLRNVRNRFLSDMASRTASLAIQVISINSSRCVIWIKTTATGSIRFFT
jgi:hypothetical protein